jgi:hypothetical protein
MNHVSRYVSKLRDGGAVHVVTAKSGLLGDQSGRRVQFVS